MFTLHKPLTRGLLLARNMFFMTAHKSSSYLRLFRKRKTYFIGCWCQGFCGSWWVHLRSDWMFGSWGKDQLYYSWWCVVHFWDCWHCIIVRDIDNEWTPWRLPKDVIVQIGAKTTYFMSTVFLFFEGLNDSCIGLTGLYWGLNFEYWILPHILLYK